MTECDKPGFIIKWDEGTMDRGDDGPRGRRDDGMKEPMSNARNNLYRGTKVRRND